MSARTHWFTRGEILSAARLDRDDDVEAALRHAAAGLPEGEYGTTVARRAAAGGVTEARALEALGEWYDSVRADRAGVDR